MKVRISIAVAIAALAFASVALAKAVTFAGEVSGDTHSTVGRIGLIFNFNGDGEPTKLLSGSYNSIDAECPDGGRVGALGPIGSAKVKKRGSNYTFKWEGDSGPSGTASIKGEIPKSGKKVSGTFGQSFNAGSVTNPYICTSNNVKFEFKRE